MSVTTAPVLAGAALKAEASRLAIPGRSKMTADQLRQAVASAQTAIQVAASETAAALDAWAAEAATSVPHQRSQAMVEAGAPADGLSDPTWGPLYAALFDHLTPAPMTPTVFATRWGKRKSSLNGRTHRTTR